MLYALFVILGASLWATDTIFRHPLVNQFSPTTLVLVEHMIATAFATAILAFNRFALKKKETFFPSPTGMLGVALIGVLGSAIATVLFTFSFQFVNPTVSILLQKIQPIVVILLSTLFLNEKLPKWFWLLAILAFGSAFFISFPHGFKANTWVDELKEADGKGVLLAFSAAVFWAVSTVIGKSLMTGTKAVRLSSSVLSFWRFFFGLVGMMMVYMVVPQTRIDLEFISVDSKVLQSLAYMAIVPGFIAVSIYYKGLSKVPASVATLLELSFPLSALIINWVVLKMPLEPIQMIASAVLLVSMIALSASQNKDHQGNTSPS